jgi:curved DNA-binding protein CbpA
MIPRPSPALLQALALMRAPRGARPGPEDRLPDGVELLVRIVGGDSQALALAAQSTRESEAMLRDAAAFYIQQVMFATDSDSYRVLGLDAGASDEQLKSHHRWLTRWLHPDRNRDEWEAVYSERVNRAWQDLRTSERRQRYDGSRAGSAAPASTYPGGKRAAGSGLRLDAAEPGISLRWLPHAIFGGLGLSAVAIVALYYVLRLSSQSPDSNAGPVGDDRPFESSALVNPRIAQGEIKAPSTEVPESLASNPETPAVAKRPAPPPTVAAEIARPLPSAALSSAIPPPALGPADPRALRAPASQGIVPALGLVKPRLEAPQPKRAPSPSSGTVSGHDIIPAGSMPVVKVAVRDAPGAAPVSQREANRILSRFSEVYADGDLAGMRAMFTVDASSQDGGLDAILKEYDQLFGHSKHRVLSMQDVNWSSSGKTFTIVASYEATMKTGLLTRVHSQGKLRLDMREVNDQWRIYRLENNERTD